MIMISNFLLFASISLNIVLVGLLLKRSHKFSVREYKQLLSIIHETCERSYKLFYSTVFAPINVVKEPLNDIEYEKLRKDFYKMVLDNLGPNLINHAVSYLGSKDVLIRYIATFFEERLIVDRVISMTNKSVLEDPILRMHYINVLAKKK